MTSEPDILPYFTAENVFFTCEMFLNIGVEEICILIYENSKKRIFYPQVKLLNINPTFRGYIFLLIGALKHLRQNWWWWCGGGCNTFLSLNIVKVTDTFLII